MSNAPGVLVPSPSGSDAFDAHLPSSTSFESTKPRQPHIQTDQYAIGSDQWTPIVGPPLPKKRKLESQVPVLPASELQTDHGAQQLVDLFERERSASPSGLDLTDELGESFLVSTEQKVSLYVACFEEMLSTVLEHEHYLFSQPELRVLKAWHSLPYASRYLFVRLFMRKRSNWFRIDKLQNYQRDIDDIHQACLDLCNPLDEYGGIASKFFGGHDYSQSVHVQNSPAEQDPQPAITEPTLQQSTALNLPPVISGSDLSDIPSEALEDWCFAAGLFSQYLDRALVNLDIKPWTLPTTPSFLQHSVLPPISSPTRVQTAKSKKSSVSPPPCSPPALPENLSELNFFAFITTNCHIPLNTDELLSCMTLDELKHLARQMGSNPHTTRDLLISSLKASAGNQSTLCGGLSGKGKGKKQLSLKFDRRGLKDRQISSLNSRILKVIGPCIKLSPEICSLFSRLHLVFYRSTTVTEKTMTASMLARMKLRAYPAYQVVRLHSLFDSRGDLLKYESALALEKSFEDLLGSPPDEPQTRIRLDTKEERERRRALKENRLKQALAIFEDAWVEWQEAVLAEGALQERRQLELGAPAVQGSEEIADYDRLNYYKKRFRPGWPLTRIVHKGSAILSRFRQYEREVEVLVALLRQNHFRRGHRGAWYDRLALVFMTHLSTANADPEQKAYHRQSALYTCEQGLSDPNTHEVYRLSLTRRVSRLRGTLPASSDGRSPEARDTAFSHHKVSITGERVDFGGEVGKKSLWLNPFDGSHSTVEEVCLAHYAAKGWRGFHAEGSILTMMFSLIFWDVIFAPVDGVFETSFQSAPLDMVTDAFAIVRAPMIASLFQAIESRGIIEAQERMRKTYEREVDRRTWCIGIHWDKYGLDDLLEIVECLGVKGVLAICKILMEDWKHRVGGVPDLCLWKYEQKRCKFVEVKGPADRLSDKQIAWINLLSIVADVEVEECCVRPLSPVIS